MILDYLKDLLSKLDIDNLSQLSARKQWTLLYSQLHPEVPSLVCIEDSTVRSDGNLGSAKCEHGKNTRYCRICNACKHGKAKFLCNLCKSCPHGRLRKNCKFCVGCPHGKLKHGCRECNACPHGKARRSCKFCSGCPHGRVRQDCRICCGCPHGKLRRGCVLCVPCPHGKLKSKFAWIALHVLTENAKIFAASVSAASMGK